MQTYFYCSNVPYHHLSCFSWDASPFSQSSILFLARVTEAFSVEYITRNKQVKLSKFNSIIVAVSKLQCGYSTIKITYNCLYINGGLGYNVQVHMSYSCTMYQRFPFTVHCQIDETKITYKQFNDYSICHRLINGIWHWLCVCSECCFFNRKLEIVHINPKGLDYISLNDMHIEQLYTPSSLQ